jgi:hypothetical protein
MSTSAARHDSYQSFGARQGDGSPVRRRDILGGSSTSTTELRRDRVGVLAPDTLRKPLIEAPKSHAALFGAEDASKAGLPVVKSDPKSEQWEMICVFGRSTLLSALLACTRGIPPRRCFSGRQGTEAANKPNPRDSIEGRIVSASVLAWGQFRRTPSTTGAMAEQARAHGLPTTTCPATGRDLRRTSQHPASRLLESMRTLFRPRPRVLGAMCPVCVPRRTARRYKLLVSVGQPKVLVRGTFSLIRPRLETA